jgi:hypothetical protein
MAISHLLAVQAKARERARPRLKHSNHVVRPPTQAAARADHGTRYSIPQRTQALTLLTIGYTFKEVEEWLKIPDRTLRRIQAKAAERGYRPHEDYRILLYHVEDGKGPGRPREINCEIESRLLNLVVADRSGREKSSDILAYECGISSSSALRILHRHQFSSVKPTRKPGLNKAQRKARLDFCLEHRNWTLEDWKSVIWSDETSVILSRRGTQRLWRRSDEAFVPSVIRNRWKGFSEFMFWGSFSYDAIGPCHVWKPETPAERREAIQEVERLNTEIEDEKKTEWELTTGLKRLGLRNAPGRRPEWRFTERTGKLVRKGAGGIDWYRYSQASYSILFYMGISTNIGSRRLS